MEDKTVLQKNKLFSNKNFWLLFLGKSVSKLGDSMYLFALTWYILEQYKSPLLASITMLLGVIPVIVISPISGVLIDRLNRKYIIVITDIIQGISILAVFVCAQIGVLNIFVIYAVSLILGTCGAIFNPTCTALIPSIVNEEDLPKAQGLDMVISNISNIIGVIFSGIAYNIIGFALISMFNGISFLLSAFSESFIKVPKQKREDVSINFKKEMLEGIQVLKDNTSLGHLFIYATLFNFVYAPFYSIYLPVIVNENFTDSATRLGLIQAIYGVGGIIGAIIVSSIANKRALSSILIKGLRGSNLFTLFMVIPILPCILSKISVFQLTIIFLIIFLIIGIFGSYVSVPVGVIFQREVPDELLGRVSALVATISSVSVPAGYLLGGALAQYMPIYIVILGSLAILAILVFFMKRDKEILQL